MASVRSTYFYRLCFSSLLMIYDKEILLLVMSLLKFKTGIVRSDSFFFLSVFSN